MTTNRPLLNSHMALYGDTQKSLAEALSLSLSRLNAKINGTNGAGFTIAEAEKIKSRYSLEPETAGLIFFTEEVS